MSKKRLVINIFSNWSSFAVLIIIRFLMTPFLIYQLGDQDYGIWILILSVIGSMELLNFGLNASIIRYVSKYAQIKDYKKENEIFNTAFSMFLLLALLVVISGFVLTMLMPFFYDFGGQPLYQVIFMVVAINLAFEFIFHTFSATLSAKQKYFEMNIVIVSSSLINVGLVVLFLLMGYKLLSIAIIQVCTNLLRGTILSFYSLKVSPEITVDFKTIKKEAFKNIFNFSFYNLLLKSSEKIKLTGSMLLIGYFLSAGAITFYSIAVSLINYLHTLILEMQKTLLPRFSQLDAQNRNKEIQDQYLAFTRYTLIIAIPIIYVFIFYGEPFIKLWIGDKYASLAGQILFILAVGKIFHISQLTTETTLKGMNKHKNLSFLRILEAISVFVLCIPLVKRYELIGMAYANAIPAVFFNLIVVPIYTCHLLKISMSRYYIQYIFKNAFAILPLLLLSQLVHYPVNSYFVLGLSIIFIFAIFFVLSFILILDSKEKQLVYSLLRIGK